MKIMQEYFEEPDFFEVILKSIFEEIVQFIVKYDDYNSKEALQIEIENRRILMKTRANNLEIL